MLALTSYRYPHFAHIVMPSASCYSLDFPPGSYPGEQDAAIVAAAGGRRNMYATFVTIGGVVGVLSEGERIRWYSPSLEDFEWRTIPKSDDEALSLLEGSPHSPTCRETYQEWRPIRNGDLSGMA